MDRWKSRGGKSQRREEQKREDQRRESLRRKKIQVRAKVGKSRSIVFLQWFVAPGSLKRRVRSHLARWEMKSCGAKPIPKSKCTKHHMFRWLLEVEMSKKCRPLWRESHFEVKSKKTQGYGALLDVQMSYQFQLQSPLHYTHYTTLHYNYTTTTTTTATTTKLNNTTSTATTTTATTTTITTTIALQLQLLLRLQLRCISLHYTTLITLHYTTLHFTSLHYTQLHCTTLQLQLQLHYIALHYTNYITLYSLHYTTLR